MKEGDHKVENSLQEADDALETLRCYDDRHNVKHNCEL